MSKDQSGNYCPMVAFRSAKDDIKRSDGTKPMLTKRNEVARAAAVLVAGLLVAGCGTSSTPPVAVPIDTPAIAPSDTAAAPSDTAAQPAVKTQVTFFVAGMNHRLKIL